MEDIWRGKHISGSSESRGYITVYPPKMVDRLEQKVSEASLSDVRAQALLMELFSKAHSFGCDKQGRINLNDKLLDHAESMESCIGWKLLCFRNLVGGPLLEEACGG